MSPAAAAAGQFEFPELAGEGNDRFRRTVRHDGRNDFLGLIAQSPNLYDRRLAGFRVLRDAASCRTPVRPNP